MLKKFSKSLYLLVFGLLIAVMVGFTACSGGLMDTVPFNLNSLSEDFAPPKITFIRSSEEFDDFLSDRTVFVESFNKEFTGENAKYNDDFFEKNDLIALILQATSGAIKGYKLDDISVSGSSWVLAVSEVAEKSTVTDDMGAYFCYYITVEKNSDVIDAKIK
ncbi:MAG: hypothetical protein J6Z36_02320 [Clostridia bacterium]|nr:hypothetical protein [Clostridia bacterium]